MFSQRVVLVFMAATEYLTTTNQEVLLGAHILRVQTAHHSREVTAIGGWGNWSPCSHSQEVEKDEYLL